MDNIIETTARHLRAGDVLAGSGFRVTHSAYRGLRTPKGKVTLGGYYPKGDNLLVNWNASTTVTVIRK